MIAGIVAASIVTDRRMRARGAPPRLDSEIVMWAVPFGLVGARLYHVLSSPDKYWGAGGEGLIGTLKIWEGGISIWGAVAGGALGAWIACRRLGLSYTFFADCIAVGLPVGQVIARLGNWFNNELYGGRTDLPWGLEVHKMAGGSAEIGADGKPVLLEGLYHPAFLYEMVWNLGVIALILWLERRYKFGRGRTFALYAMAYTAGRAWIEALRVDEALVFFGQRLNVWVSILLFLLALAYFLLRRGQREFVIPHPDGKGFRSVTEQEFREYRARESTASRSDEKSAQVDSDLQA